MCDPTSGLGFEPSTAANSLAGRPHARLADVTVPKPTSGRENLLESTKLWLISQSQVVDAVQHGYAIFDWVPVPGVEGLEVFADALRIFDVRVPVTAITTARIAELLDASPTTALIEDLIFNTATVRIVPPTWDYRIMMSCRAVFGQSLRIDAQIAKAGAPPRGALVSCVGKSWIIDNASVEHPGQAVNYGLHRPDGPYASIDGKSRVWQTPGTIHGPDHWDYSQVLRLCRWRGSGPLPSHQPLRTQRLYS